MLVHEWHPTALLRIVLLSFPQHPRLMVGKRSPAFRFQLFFFGCGTVQKDNSKPHTHLRLSPCAVRPAFGCGEKNTLTIWQLAALSLPPHRHGRGQGVETSLVCRRVARGCNNRMNTISFPDLILEAHSAECHYSLFFSSSAKMLSTYLTIHSYSLPLFSLSA